MLRGGGVIAYPTDSGYALGCCLGDKKAIEKIKWLRSLDDKHSFTLVCSDLSEIGTYAKVDNAVFRLLKAPRRGLHLHPQRHQRSAAPAAAPKRRSIGVRAGPPHHPCAARRPGRAADERDADSGGRGPADDRSRGDRDRFGAHLDAVIDGGACHLDPTTVVDVREIPPTIVREGRGDIAPFQ